MDQINVNASFSIVEPLSLASDWTKNGKVKSGNCKTGEEVSAFFM